MNDEMKSDEKNEAIEKTASDLRIASRKESAHKRVLHVRTGIKAGPESQVGNGTR